MCKHTFLFTSHSKVCTSCGNEEPVLTLDVYNTYSAPLLKGYERTVRFRQKTDKLLYLRNPPPRDCPIWLFLKNQSMCSPQDIRTALRRYKGKNKHYDSIRMFTRVFTQFRVATQRNVIELDTRLSELFGCVLRFWRMNSNIPFFSY